MLRFLFLISLIFLTSGCRNKPFVTLMRGDMKMSGGMKMEGEVATVMRTDNTATRLASVPVYGSVHTCQGRVCVVDVDGLLVNKNMSGFGSMGENPVALFREKLDSIVADASIQAIVLRINSSGGGVTACDMMSRDLEQIIKSKNIPVVACIMEAGAGGAYYLAIGADKVVAQPTALVGGVGVILNVYNLEDLMGQFGIAAIPVKSGEKIDMGSPLRSMEDDERTALKELASQFHQRFTDRVKQYRKLAISRNNEQDIYDGRIITGLQAKELGMVDEIGYLDDAISSARQLAGLPDNAPLVMLRRDNDRAFTAFDVTPNTPTMSSILPLKVPGLDRASLPTFLYLWQPEPTNQ
jgi:protease IV